VVGELGSLWFVFLFGAWFVGVPRVREGYGGMS